MQIEIKRIHHLPDSGKMKAFADVMLDGVTIIIKGCKIFEGTKGLFVALPSQKSEKDDKYYPIVVMPVRDQYDVMQKVVLEAYDGRAPAPIEEPGPGSEPGAGAGEGPGPAPGGDAIFDGPDGNDSVPF